MLLQGARNLLRKRRPGTDEYRNAEAEVAAYEGDLRRLEAEQLVSSPMRSSSPPAGNRIGTTSGRSGKKRGVANGGRVRSESPSSPTQMLPKWWDLTEGQQEAAVMCVLLLSFLS
jgi:hypothetical protein